MSRLNEIITEAINNQLLFSNLNILANQIERSANALKRSNANNNIEIATFFNDLYIFSEALVDAIRRCIRANNLNEMNGSWGFQNIPAFSNLYYSMKNGLNTNVMGDIANNIRRIKNNFQGRGDYYYGNNNTRGNSLYNTMNNPRSQKLQMLLTQYYPIIQRKYMSLNRKYNNAIASMNPSYAKSIITDVENVISAVRNAQGQNP